MFITPKKTVNELLLRREVSLHVRSVYKMCFNFLFVFYSMPAADSIVIQKKTTQKKHRKRHVSKQEFTPKVTISSFVIFNCGLVSWDRMKQAA